MSRAIPLLPLLPSWSGRQLYLFLQSTIAVAERRPNVSHNSMPNSPSNITARFFYKRGTGDRVRAVYQLYFMVENKLQKFWLSCFTFSLKRSFYLFRVSAFVNKQCCCMDFKPHQSTAICTVYIWQKDASITWRPITYVNKHKCYWKPR